MPSRFCEVLIYEGGYDIISITPFSFIIGTENDNT
jgi:hypothetical protein